MGVPVESHWSGRHGCEGGSGFLQGPVNAVWPYPMPFDVV